MGESGAKRWRVGESVVDGAFVRRPSAFREAVTADGSSGHPAAPGRYHLYVSLACPWAHRTIIVRRLKRLEDVIGMTVVDPIRDERGWAFRDVPGAARDPLHGWSLLAEAYEATAPGYDGRVSVPVLWDSEAGRVVSNESADIIRMLDTEFDAFTDVRLDLYPAELREAIDDVNDRVYTTVNDGVYKAGFARSQRAHERAVHDLFDTLDWLEERLGRHPYVAGDRITEADWRLFTTGIRFDTVYHGHFKCNVRRLVDYPRLWSLVRELYHVPGVAGTVDFDHIKRHYYMTHRSINPTGIVPVGPALDLDEPWQGIRPGRPAREERAA
jgi:putative glutathione S-transferase